LNTAVKMLEKNPAKAGESNVILLFTDGENHSKPEDLEKALEGVRRIGAKLIIVGNGSTDPSYIPLYSTDGKPLYEKDGKRSYHKMSDGTIAETARNDAFMQELAASVGGTYIVAEDGRALNIDWPTSFAGSRVEIAKRYLYGPLLAAMMVILTLIWLVGPIAGRVSNARQQRARSRGPGPA